MDGRREPRFQIYAPGKLTLVDSPERELECMLLDISATGMKLVTDEGLPVDEVVALEVEDHLVLADVRYSEPRGDKFAIGAERIHAVDKSALPPDKTRAEQIRFVVTITAIGFG
jgi:c-di-GMP-binding flagellar brake protein YcgR